MGARDAIGAALDQELGVAFDMLDGPGRRLLLVAITANGSEGRRAWRSSPTASRRDVLTMVMALDRQKRDLMRAAGLTDEDLDGYGVVGMPDVDPH